ncbi:hypothetical protein V6N13_083800 [Hibiscus sabdariffa]|uniref:Uncharacterized protein n=1 Tax=Hibiscus sabdariffa TaxID=183260 RepID=A0ABR2SZX3_9ROSI
MVSTFSMHSDKASGPDGMNPMWEMTGFCSVTNGCKKYSVSFNGFEVGPISPKGLDIEGLWAKFAAAQGKGISLALSYKVCPMQSQPRIAAIVPHSTCSFVKGMSGFSKVTHKLA